MSTVIVFGASGLLGASLVPTLRAIGHVVLTQGRGEGVDLCFDPSDRAAVIAALGMHRPAAIVNLVAATNVDQCESLPELAWQANAAVVASITNSIVACGVGGALLLPHLVHVSTDQLYDGLGPHAEEEISPINVYGLSKYVGELLAERVGATVLRSNFYGRSRCASRVSFSDWLVNSLREGEPITVFNDVKFSAMHIDTLCSIIARCIERRPAGIFNAGCRDSISKADFAIALARAIGLPLTAMKIGSSADVDFRARRPLDMSLKVAKLEAILDIQCPSIYYEIEHTAKEYLNV